MKHNRIIVYIGKGLVRFSDDNGINWTAKQLTEFIGPQTLKVI